MCRFGLLCLFYLSVVICRVDNKSNIKMVIEQIQRDVGKEWKFLVDETKPGLLDPTAPFKKNRKRTVFSKKSWSNCKVIRLYCRLARKNVVVRNNKVMAVSNENMKPEEGVFQIESYGPSVVRLLHVESKRYIVLTKEGTIETSPKKTNESLFYQNLEESHYATFASELYYHNVTRDLFFAMKQNGIPKKPRKTKAGQKTSHFLSIDVNSRTCSRLL